MDPLKAGWAVVGVAAAGLVVTGAALLPSSGEPEQVRLVEPAVGITTPTAEPTPTSPMLSVPAAPRTSPAVVAADPAPVGTPVAPARVAAQTSEPAATVDPVTEPEPEPTSVYTPPPGANPLPAPPADHGWTGGGVITPMPVNPPAGGGAPAPTP